MVDFSSLRGYDSSKHQVTQDFRLVHKGAKGESFLPEDLAGALSKYLQEASKEQILELDKAVSKGTTSSEQIRLLKGKIRKQNPEKYLGMRNIFRAYARPELFTPSPHAAQAAAASAHLPTHSKPSCESKLKEAIKQINHAFGSNLKFIEDLSMNDLCEMLPAFVISEVSKKEPMSEHKLNRITGLIESNRELFSNVSGPLVDHILKTSKVLKSGTFTKASEASGGGVYMGKFSGSTHIVIKPQAEELKAPFNPSAKGVLMPDGSIYQMRAPMGTHIRDGFVSGEGAMRERDAYVTDLQDGLFSKTPPTLLVKIRCRSPMVREGSSQFKIASVQAFVEGKTPSMAELKSLSQEGLERIAYADIDEGNADRHLAGNLFMTPSGDVQRIDQGMTRGPEPSCCKFGWMDTYQVSRPMTEIAKKKIQEQNIEARVQALKTLGVSSEAIELERARIMIKKSAALLGLTFYDIGVILTPALDQHKQKVCEFDNILRRAASSKDLSKEVDAITTSIRDWKVHISKSYQANPIAAQSEVKKMIAHPYLYRALSRHLEILGGK